MARIGIIEKWGLQREANALLVPKNGKEMAYADIAMELTRMARQKALRENEDMAPSLLQEIVISEQAVRRYVQSNPKAKSKVMADDRQKATEAVSATIAGATVLIEQITEIRAYLTAWKKKEGADTDKDKLHKIDYKLMDRMHGRLESMVATLFQIQSAAFNPEVMGRFFETLDAELVECFGLGAPDRLKARLVTKPEFLALADVLGWQKPEETPEPPKPDQPLVN